MSIKYIKTIKEQSDIDILIPAAGLGSRMKSYGPKPLIELKNNKTIIDNQLSIFNRILPKANIILVCGFGADYLMNNTCKGIYKVENERYEETNVVRSLGIGLRICQKDVLVVYGDLVFNKECLLSMNLNKSSLLCGKNLMSEREVGCIYNNNRLVNMMYDLEHKWSQIAFFRGKELSLLKEICWNKENENLFGFEAINEIVRRGGKFSICENDKAKAIDIDTYKDLEKIEGIV